jgi:hypothetical protein
MGWFENGAVVAEERSFCPDRDRVIHDRAVLDRSLVVRLTRPHAYFR